MIGDGEGRVVVASRRHLPLRPCCWLILCMANKRRTRARRGENKRGDRKPRGEERSGEMARKRRVRHWRKRRSTTQIVHDRNQPANREGDQRTSRTPPLLAPWPPSRLFRWCCRVVLALHFLQEHLERSTDILVVLGRGLDVRCRELLGQSFSLGFAHRPACQLGVTSSLYG